ncbi:hypothetical protein PHYBLDRAFT_161881 [Phycomyces blakesleeanus NRRL 1555(-)]|uniref:Ndc10 domain-containing protein n=1 Tax=Phycomyces blakesleeanus (strain ATCC 8743b / DSM 1359 / FGSC 10004 / NBRC 33097 / NRRL 1555) TaxID=763407 RepID=A0A162VAM3_PHYB8|nr:hypothetical protein PHYBLDRAFT_161881 [Phycomyces blakesleeanus NRRL 1555(-)]OAD81262.1 hypothetical protein PHYBLDRAFT_161881 [Phycomyces blakesleeanus NRRL 1555(-)]|eukprot:XP_018299302.1 hypothetical protein PHYBLDRAFT_161881 [Phycomyces blakesleeanus NRRL 1555(-)]
MTGFWGKPFSLARNGVSPPMELQKMLFPWIEDYFGVSNAEWVAVCEKEMNEVDENEDEDENIINFEIDEEADSVEFVEEDKRLQSKEKKRKGKQRAIQSSINTAKQNRHINTRNLPFSSNSFRMFQKDIVAAITSPSIGRLEEYESLVPKIVNTNKEIASRVTEQQQESQFEKNENSFNNFIEQSNQQNCLLMNTTQQLAKVIKILVIWQHCLNSQIQLLMTTNNASQGINTNASLSQPPIIPVLSTTHSTGKIG